MRPFCAAAQVGEDEGESCGGGRGGAAGRLGSCATNEPDAVSGSVDRARWAAAVGSGRLCGLDDGGLRVFRDGGRAAPCPMLGPLPGLRALDYESRRSVMGFLTASKSGRFALAAAEAQRGGIGAGPAPVVFLWGSARQLPPRLLALQVALGKDR